MGIYKRLQEALEDFNKDLLHNIDNSGIRYEDEGRSREVYFDTVNKKIYKLEKSKTGGRINKLELQTWRVVKDTSYEDYFANIHPASTEECIVMDFVPNNDRSAYRKVRNLNYLDGVEDVSPPNVGSTRDEKPVIFDYPWGSIELPDMPPSKFFSFDYRDDEDKLMNL